MRLSKRAKNNLCLGIVEKIYPRAWFHEKKKAISDWLADGSCKELTEAAGFLKEYPGFVAESTDTVYFSATFSDSYCMRYCNHMDFRLPFEYACKYNEKTSSFEDVEFSLDEYGKMAVSFGIKLPGDIEEDAKEILLWMQKRKDFEVHLRETLKCTDTVSQLKKKLPDAAGLIDSILSA